MSRELKYTSLKWFLTVLFLLFLYWVWGPTFIHSEGIDFRWGGKSYGEPFSFFWDGFWYCFVCSGLVGIVYLAFLWASIRNHKRLPIMRKNLWWGVKGIFILLFWLALWSIWRADDQVLIASEDVGKHTHYRWGIVYHKPEQHVEINNLALQTCVFYTIVATLLFTIGM